MLNKFLAVLSFAVVAAAAASLSGCGAGSFGSMPLNKAQLSQAISDAEQKAATRGADYTLSKLKQLTTTNPTDAQPWSQMAKVYFDHGQYGQAIVAADEALQRNPQDFLAKSIWVVGGLRLAQKGILDMKTDAKLAGNAERDATALAESMRQVLGVNVFPSMNTAPGTGPIIYESPRRAHRAYPSNVAHQADASARPAESHQKAPVSNQGGNPGNSNDPFGLLLQ